MPAQHWKLVTEQTHSHFQLLHRVFSQAELTHSPALESQLKPHLFQTTYNSRPPRPPPSFLYLYIFS